MSEFDFTTLKRGDKVNRRDGQSVEILITDGPMRFDGKLRPIVVLHENVFGNIEMWNYASNGRWWGMLDGESPFDLMPPKRKLMYWVAMIQCENGDLLADAWDSEPDPNAYGKQLLAITGPHEIEEGQGM